MTNRGSRQRRNRRADDDDDDEHNPEALAFVDPVQRRVIMRFADGSFTADGLADLTGLELSEVQRMLEYFVEVHLVVRQREGVGHEMYYALHPRVRITRDGEFTEVRIRGHGEDRMELSLRAPSEMWM